jgi:hypothetical protein
MSLNSYVTNPFLGTRVFQGPPVVSGSSPTDFEKPAVDEIGRIQFKHLANGDSCCKMFGGVAINLEKIDFDKASREGNPKVKYKILPNDWVFRK